MEKSMFSKLTDIPIPSGCALPRGKIDNVNILVHRVGIETGRQCNLRCNYCFAASGKPLDNELNTKELFDLINQAYDVGASIIPIIGGGEPTLNQDLMKIIDHIVDRGITPGLFTNGLIMTNRMAKRLFESNAYIVTKINSFNDDIEDLILGVRGASKRTKRGIKIFQDEGFASTSPSRLSLHTIITIFNYSEIPAIYCWERENNIIPYMQLPVLTGRADSKITITIQQAKDLFYTLRDIDRSKYNYDWIPHPPNVGWACTQRQTSCYVTSTGDVQLCSGTDIAFGNIRNQKLRDILLSPQFQEARNLKNIKGKCKNCSYLGKKCCAGCTGNNYNSTGDIFSSDERCWHST